MSAKSTKLQSVIDRFSTAIALASLLTGCGLGADKANDGPSDKSQTASEAYVREGLARSAYPRSLPNGFVRLSDQQIDRYLRNATIESDRDSPNKTTRFREEFHQDGSWKTNRYENVTLVKYGKWISAGNELCVREYGGKTKCRQVWYNPVSKKFALQDMGSSLDLFIICTKVSGNAA